MRTIQDNAAYDVSSLPQDQAGIYAPYSPRTVSTGFYSESSLCLSRIFLSLAVIVVVEENHCTSPGAINVLENSAPN
jgi:hypothetical protein